MNNYYYVAYGSNLHKEQMKHRCPDSQFMCSGMLKNHKLIFKGSYTGYATIQQEHSSNVPVAIYQVSDEDLKRLDIYEGVSKNIYSRDEIDLTEINRDIIFDKSKAFIYRMMDNPSVNLMPPSTQYLQILWESYRDLKFDLDCLYFALQESVYR